MRDRRSTGQLISHHFLSWQCRIRQHAVRTQDGRPSEGMQSCIIIDNHEIAKLTVLINKKELAEPIAEFRFIYKKTHDPAIRRESALEVLVAGYFQRAEEFSGRLTASVSKDSETAKKILAAKEVVLYFYQQNQQYKIPCIAKELIGDEYEFQATYWYNSLFNPNLPPTIRIIAFDPNWEYAQADPSPNDLPMTPHTG